MAITDDVLVIGGGLAGITAALSAAEYGVTVRLVSAKQSTLRHASGLIDVLGYVPDASDAHGDAAGDDAADGEAPLADPFAAIRNLPAGHPYERVGLETVREALLFFDAVVGDAYAGAHTDANALVPTTGGTVKPTARYPATTAAGLASDRRNALLVGFETIPEFDAPLAAAHLRAAGVPFGVRGVTVRFPGDLRDDARRTRYARALDRNEFLGRDDGTAANGVRARPALAGAVRPHLEGAGRVGFPAILGETNPGVVRQDLRERLGADVFEVPTGPPSLPGMRLEKDLYDALEDAGVRVTTGVPVVDYETEGRTGSSGEGTNSSGAGRTTASAGDRIDRVIVDREGSAIPHRADQYVLATGGLVGKGVRSDRERVVEPVFDCHVPHPSERYAWFADDTFGDHPFARFGVAVDRELRPLDADDEPEFSNLRAAGGVLGGYDYAAEKSGSGVSLATGYAAGRRAGAEVSG